MLKDTREDVQTKTDKIENRGIEIIQQNQIKILEIKHTNYTCSFVSIQNDNSYLLYSPNLIK